MSDDQKPERPERIYTLSLEFNSASMEPYVNCLLKKMKNVLPQFLVNVAYKTKPVQHLFSTNYKAKIPYEETTNLCYNFKCECGSQYVGQTGRTLEERAREHQQLSNAKGIYWHIKRCPEYRQKENLFIPNRYMTTKQKNFLFYLNHFNILQKGFRSFFECQRAEAFFIRVKRPDLNDQQDHACFKLFQNGNY